MDTFFITLGKDLYIGYLTLLVLSLRIISLSEWLVHRKTCPQCREKCLPRQVSHLLNRDCEQTHCVHPPSTTVWWAGPERLFQVLKLFIDGRNIATTVQSNVQDLNQDELRVWLHKTSLCIL